MYGRLWFNSVEGKWGLWPLWTPEVKAINYLSWFEVFGGLTRLDQVHVVDDDGPGVCLVYDDMDHILRGISRDNFIELVTAYEEQMRHCALQHAESHREVDALEKSGRYSADEIAGARRCVEQQHERHDPAWYHSRTWWD